MRKNQSESGFTLIETAITLVLLMIVSLGVATLSVYAIRNNATANDRELAMAVAQKRIEWLRSITFNSTNAAIDYAFPGGGLKATGSPVVETTSNGRSYTVTTTITDTKTETGTSATALAEPSTIKTITVSVKPIADTSTVFLSTVTLTTQRAMLREGLNQN